jgi:hypothetical protein
MRVTDDHTATGAAPKAPESAVAGSALLRLWGYTSSYTGTDIESDLRDIAEVSSRNNRRSGVTGALLFDSGRFVQVLEGPEASIARIVACIGEDPRCGEMVELFDVRVTHRSMDAWDLWVGRTSGDKGLAADELARFRDMYQRGFRLDAGGFVTVLRSLIQTFSGSP